MAKRALPSPEDLRNLLRYEPETGKLYWRHRADGRQSWNTRYAGREAFTCIDHYGYYIGNVRGVGAKAHRVAMAIVDGAWPMADVDHVNGIRSDNRLCNLRHATRSQNLANRSVVSGASRFLGVRRLFGKWEARTSLGNKTISAGRFDTEEEAAKAYDEIARSVHGEFAHLNFPDARSGP